MSGTYEVTITVQDNQPGRARVAARKQLLNVLCPDLAELGLTDMNFDVVSKRVAEVIRD